MKFKHTLTVAAALAAAICASAEPFKVIAPLSPDDDGAMARLVNYDTGATIDSVLVSDQAAVFTGEIDEPVLARVAIEGSRQPVFILESGTISFKRDGSGAFGTMLNDELRKIGDSLGEITVQYRQAQTEAQAAAAYTKYMATLDSATKANADNALGYFLFLNGDASQMKAAELEALLAANPSFGKYERAKKILAMAKTREATQEGGKFIDFEVTYDGKTSKLSDHVGKGHYTLVDFWASWCNPCIRQTVVLKDIYNKYKDKGLEVLGVAVWDKPEDTKRAIKEHDLPWECIIDAQTIPTDLYGISGIPCIILFGPDGTILSRDKQDDDLRADVDKYLSEKK